VTLYNFKINHFIKQFIILAKKYITQEQLSCNNDLLHAVEWKFFAPLAKREAVTYEK
jgi:hypothetical protein